MQWIKHWLSEQWHDIRFAEKSMQVKIVLLMLAASWVTWRYAEYSFSGDLTDKDNAILELKTENAKLKAAQPKCQNKSSAVPNGDSLSDDLEDKIYEMKNDINNMKSNANTHYQLYKQRVVR